MATPSLAMIPSGYKAQKVYSVLPTNGDGDFTFARSGTATRVNQSGLIETVGNNVPRLDYSNGGCPSLLLEPQRTNLIPYSEDFSKGDWNNQFGGVASAPIVTSNYSISPDGTLNADRIIFNLNGGTTGSDFSQITDRVTTIVGDTTHSVWIKSNTTSNYSMSFVDAFSSFTSIIVTPEWQRFDLTFTTATTYNDFKLRLRGNESTSDYADVSVWGAQIEQGSYATSYIPTNGSSFTRFAETCNGAGDASTFNDSEGVLYAEIAALANDGTSRRIALSDGSISNRISLEFDEAANVLKVFSVTTGVTVLQYTAQDLTLFNKIGVKYKLNDFALWINGFEVDTNNSALIPSGLDRLNFDGGDLNNDFYGNIKQIQYFDTALTDSELQALTTI